jgi:hypothetical protein
VEVVVEQEVEEELVLQEDPGGAWRNRSSKFYQDQFSKFMQEEVEVSSSGTPTLMQQVEQVVVEQVDKDILVVQEQLILEVEVEVELEVL